MKEIFKYSLPNGKIPFDEWVKKLDKSMKSKVLLRITKMQIGFYGVYKKLSKGICELKFNNGIRVYFAEIDNVIVLLLKGGNKQRQSEDIKLAQEYLQDYKERSKNGSI